MLDVIVKNKFFPAAIILFFIIVGYSGSLSNGPLIDDSVLIYQDPGVGNRHYLSYQYLVSKTSQDRFFRPVVHVILALVQPMLRGNFSGYHILSLILFTVFC